MYSLDPQEGETPLALLRTPMKPKESFWLEPNVVKRMVLSEDVWCIIISFIGSSKTFFAMKSCLRGITNHIVEIYPSCMTTIDFVAISPPTSHLNYVKSVTFEHYLKEEDLIFQTCITSSLIFGSTSKLSSNNIFRFAMDMFPRIEILNLSLKESIFKSSEIPLRVGGSDHDKNEEVPIKIKKLKIMWDISRTCHLDQKFPQLEELVMRSRISGRDLKINWNDFTNLRSMNMIGWVFSRFEGLSYGQIENFNLDALQCGRLLFLHKPLKHFIINDTSICEIFGIENCCQLETISISDEPVTRNLPTFMPHLFRTLKVLEVGTRTIVYNNIPPLIIPNGNVLERLCLIGCTFLVKFYEAKHLKCLKSEGWDTTSDTSEGKFSIVRDCGMNKLHTLDIVHSNFEEGIENSNMLLGDIISNNKNLKDINVDYIPSYIEILGYDDFLERDPAVDLNLENFTQIRSLSVSGIRSIRIKECLGFDDSGRIDNLYFGYVKSVSIEKTKTERKTWFQTDEVSLIHQKSNFGKLKVNSSSLNIEKSCYSEIRWSCRENTHTIRINIKDCSGVSEIVLDIFDCVEGAQHLIHDHLKRLVVVLRSRVVDRVKTEILSKVNNNKPGKQQQQQQQQQQQDDGDETTSVNSEEKESRQDEQNYPKNKNEEEDDEEEEKGAADSTQIPTKEKKTGLSKEKISEVLKRVEEEYDNSENLLDRIEEREEFKRTNEMAHASLVFSLKREELEVSLKEKESELSMMKRMLEHQDDLIFELQHEIDNIELEEECSGEEEDEESGDENDGESEDVKSSEEEAEPEVGEDVEESEEDEEGEDSEEEEEEGQEEDEEDDELKGELEETEPEEDEKGEEKEESDDDSLGLLESDLVQNLIDRNNNMQLEDECGKGNSIVLEDLPACSRLEIRGFFPGAGFHVKNTNIKELDIMLGYIDSRNFSTIDKICILGSDFPKLEHLSIHDNSYHSKVFFDISKTNNNATSGDDDDDDDDDCQDKYLHLTQIDVLCGLKKLKKITIVQMISDDDEDLRDKPIIGSFQKIPDLKKIEVKLLDFVEDASDQTSIRYCGLDKFILKDLVGTKRPYFLQVLDCGGLSGDLETLLKEIEKKKIEMEGKME